MNRSSLLVVAGLVGLGACGSESQADFAAADAVTQTAGLTQVSSFGSNPGKLSMYLYTPATLPSTNVPVVVALHGCAQTASAYQGAGWNTLADELGFIVVYPQTTASAGCFGWFNSSDIRRDSGQVFSVKQMVDYVKTKYTVGSAYVTGLSAGGAMAEAVLAAYPDVFSAGAVMAGIPYNCGISCMSSASNRSPAAWGDLVRNSGAPTPSRWPRVSVWHGASDSIVVPVNADESVTQWTNVNGLTDTPTSTETIGAATVKRYADSTGAVRVEQWKVAGMNHGTAVDPAKGCGQTGSYLLDVKLCSSRYAAIFFGLTKPDDGYDAGQPDAGPKDAGTIDAGPPDAGAPDAGPKDAGTIDAGPSDAGSKDAGTCKETYSSNYTHTTAGRAALCSPYNGHACTVGAKNDLGVWSLAISSWVREPTAGYFEAGRCP